jgi:alkanesulfonate monooxygenase SsuD/methylene tetrahydromethanopterin reductase-like flavin-dependent oxidoreductase (luciferase family)
MDIGVSIETIAAIDYAREERMKVSYLAMAGFNGPAPAFEVWPAAPEYCDRQTAARSVNETLEICRLVDELGFDWISTAEHHYAPYMMTPNPVVMASAISQIAKRVQIALLGPLVPLTNPIRLAEEIAMLDQLSHGRVEVLFLRGTPNEHNTYDTPKDDTKGMTQEGIELIKKAWTADEPFSWKGRHYQFSTISVWPRPFQDPHPPIYGSGNSDDSILFAARNGLGIGFSFTEPEQVAASVKLYKAECEKAGWTPGPDSVIYRGLTYLAPTDQRAFDEMGAFFAQKAEAAAGLQSKTMGGPTNMPLIQAPYFVGSPQTILAKCEVLRDAGVDVIDLAYVIGSHEQQVAAIELFAKAVMPTLHAWGASRLAA